MWQRFTESARKTIFYSQEEAARLGEDYVSTEHILLGLVRDPDSVARKLLDRVGVAPDRIRPEVGRNVAFGPGRTGQDMQLTPRAKRVIDLAYDEAQKLTNNYIGAEHLLLGLIREGEGIAARVLSTLGVDLDRVRNEIRSMQGMDPKTDATPPNGGRQTEHATTSTMWHRFTERARKTIFLGAWPKIAVL